MRGWVGGYWSSSFFPVCYGSRPSGSVYNTHEKKAMSPYPTELIDLLYAAANNSIISKYNFDITCPLIG